MSELAHILHYANERSFIILDEIGRGTSTYDGMSVAWASLEWICSRVKARTLFATHYHELIRLASSLPLLANAHMAVENEKRGSSKSLRFLYELKEGPTNESFGIHVAQLAGLPKPVIERAWKVLGELESSQLNTGSHPSDHQLSLFHPRSDQSQSSALNQSPLSSSSDEMNSADFNSTAPSSLEEGVCKHCGLHENPDSLVQEDKPHPAVVAIDSINLNEITPMQAFHFLVELRSLTQASQIQESTSFSAS
jgi:DNA mismatch repair protein MutS